MMELILGALCIVLYLEGLVIASEFVDYMESHQLEEGIPLMPKSDRIKFLLAWPWHVLTILFAKAGKE